MVDMLIIIQNIYETNLLHNMLTIEVNADGEFGLLPKLEHNVKEAIRVDLHFVLCLHRSSMIQILAHCIVGSELNLLRWPNISQIDKK